MFAGSGGWKGQLEGSLVAQAECAQGVGGIGLGAGPEWIK